MAERIPYPSADALPEGIPPVNMLRMWAHAPSVFRPAIALGTACLSAVSLPVRVRELLALYCGHKQQCEYMWARHVNDAKKAGVTEAQMEAIRADKISGSVWSDAESAMFVFLAEVIASPQVTDATFALVRSHYDEKEIVEILTMQGFYYTWARVGTVLRVSVDEEKDGDYQKAKAWAEG